MLDRDHLVEIVADCVESTIFCVLRTFVLDRVELVKIMHLIERNHEDLAGICRNMHIVTNCKECAESAEKCWIGWLWIGIVEMFSDPLRVCATSQKI